MDEPIQLKVCVVCCELRVNAAAVADQLSPITGHYELVSDPEGNSALTHSYDFSSNMDMNEHLSFSGSLISTFTSFWINV